jgi:hypothetical protein
MVDIFWCELHHDEDFCSVLGCWWCKRKRTVPPETQPGRLSGHYAENLKGILVIPDLNDCKLIAFLARGYGM